MVSSNNKKWQDDFYDRTRNEEAISSITKTLNNICEDIISEQNSKYLAIIVGNGLQPQEFERRDRLIGFLAKKYKKKEEKISEEDIWDEYENHRIVSSAIGPKPVYALVYYLVFMNFSKVIVTPNYDWFLNSIFKKNKTIFQLNPIHNIIDSIPTDRFTNDYYYQNNFVDIDKNSVMKLYKYHGDVGFFSFCECYCTYPLPSKRVNYRELNSIYKKCSKKFKNKNCRLKHLVKKSRHHIDFDYCNIDRKDIFYPEIKSAIKELSSDFLCSGILVLGFTGRWHKIKKSEERSSEEIVPTIVKFAKSGKPVLMFFNPRNKKDLNQSFLCKELIELNPKLVVEGSLEINLTRIFSRIPLLEPAIGYDKVWRIRKLFEY